MVSETEYLIRALQYLCEDNKHICRLCLCSTEGSKAVDVDHQVHINKYQLKDMITVDEMLKELGAPDGEELPTTLCSNCYTVVLNSYIFTKLCHMSQERWSCALDKLDECLRKCKDVKQNYKSMYFHLRKDYTYVSIIRKKILHSKSEALSYFKKKNAISKNNLLNRNVNKRSGSLFCEMCSEKFENKSAYFNHNAQFHNDSVFECKECNKVYNDKFKLKYHYQKDHLPKTMKCEKCPKKFSNRRLLKQHIVDYHVPEVCQICLDIIPSKVQSRYHIASHQKHKCSKCTKEFTTKASCLEHEKGCGNPDGFKAIQFFCDICSKGYVTKQGLRSHIKMDHGFGATYLCTWCERVYDAPSKLKWHILKHTKEKKYCCDQCGHKFVTPAALQYHIRLHTGEKPYPCQHCKNSFSTTSRRMEHIKRKHLPPTKECKFCPMKFATGSSLNVHTKRHFDPSSKLYVRNKISKNIHMDPEGRTVMVLQLD